MNLGYIVRTSKKSVWIVHCDEILGDEPVVRMLRNSKVKHVQPFVGKVEKTVINYRMVDPRNELYTIVTKLQNILILTLTLAILFGLRRE